MKIMLIVSSVIMFLLVVLTIILKMFDGWLFFGMFFYIILFVGGYSYININMINDNEKNDVTLQERHKFNWCWERVNHILKQRPGGKGIQWASGVGRKSGIKSFHNGVQNKPFRSIIAYLEGSYNYVCIIYNIEDDDIAEFISDPSPDKISNPFYGFEPYSRGSGFGGGMQDRFGGIPGMRSSNDYRYNRNNSGINQKSNGLSINIGNNDNNGFGDLEAEEFKAKKVMPQEQDVRKVIDKLKF